MSTNITVSKWIVYMRNIVKILRDNRLSFSYNLNDHAIYTTDGSDMTPHLMAVYDEISKVEDEYWREKICKAHNIPIDILFPIYPVQ